MTRSFYEKRVFSPPLLLIFPDHVTFQDSYYLNGQLLVPTRLGIKFYTGFRLSTETEIISGVPDIFPNTNMPVNASGIWAGINIPLLRDLGRNNSKNIAFLSTLMMNRSQNVSFTDEICQFVKNTLTYYYVVYHRVKVFTILEDAEKDAKQYLTDIKQLITDEQIPKSEIYRAQAYESNTNQQLSFAMDEIINSLFDLITSIGIKGKISHQQLPLFLDSLCRRPKAGAPARRSGRRVYVQQWSSREPARSWIGRQRQLFPRLHSRGAHYLYHPQWKEVAGGERLEPGHSRAGR